MKIVKGKLYNVTLGGYVFPLVTTDADRALHFYQTVFPDEHIEPIDIVKVKSLLTKASILNCFNDVKQAWRDLKLLKAEPGTIKFNIYSLDLLLESHEHILTNV